MELVTITAPDYSMGPVTLGEVREHCRVDAGDDDSDLDLKRAAALTYVANRTGRPLSLGTFEARFMRWSNFFRIPYAPLKDITSVVYRTAGEVSQAVDSSTYLADTSDHGGVRLAYARFWPIQSLSPNRPIAIRFRAGYEDEIPDPIRQAVLLLVGHWYRNRETVTLGNNEVSRPMEFALDALLEQYVVDKFGSCFAQ